MNPVFLLRAFVGMVAGIILVGALKWGLGGEPAGRGRSRRPFPVPYVPPAAPVADLGRADAAMEIAHLGDRIKELEAKLAEDPRRTRGRDLARALGAAAKAGWDSEEAKKADAELADFLAGLARDSGVEPFEFALNPERDALFAAFLAGFGLPLDDAPSAQLAELVELEAKRWAERLELRKPQTTIERLASVYAEAADFEQRAAAILTTEQLAALSYRFRIRYHSRNPQPWADHNNVLGPREAPKRKLFGTPPKDPCYDFWYHDFQQPGSAANEILKFYAEWYEREMLGLEVPEDTRGDKTIPPAWRAKQAKIQADVQRKMLEDERLGEGEKKRIREWDRLYDPAR